MKIALVGPHRSGKTFLAEQIASRLGIQFVATRTSQVFAEMGIDPSQPMDFATRLRCQYAIFTQYRKDFQAAEGSAVFDRSPMDYSAYMLADFVESETVTSEQIDEIANYNVVCLASVFERAFDAVVIVHPHDDIPFGDEPLKGRNDPHHIQVLDHMMTGMTFNLGLYTKVISLPASLPLAERLGYVCSKL